MPNRTTEYIQTRVEGLTEYSEEIRDIEPSEVNSFDSWSALKLILHSAAVNMYTTIIPEYKGDFYYIDALSGSGVSEYDNGQCFVGSPIVAAKVASEPFSKMYFIDQDEDYCHALKSRATDTVTVEPTTDQTVVNTLVDRLKRIAADGTITRSELEGLVSDVSDRLLALLKPISADGDISSAEIKQLAEEIAENRS
ncbi:class I SAM-dependent methyltransferase [Halorussus salinisoli]|uniref:hypothetical protein n=1 Tax=Halorussus salinisoli TaxID=2558242 RepID=UPI0010C17D3A|nr:hypothetical protein [Halorussus salinisoli]